jgi:hypothetical protein
VTCHYASTRGCKPRREIYTTLQGVTTYSAPNLCRSCIGAAAEMRSLGPREVLGAASIHYTARRVVVFPIGKLRCRSKNTAVVRGGMVKVPVDAS